MMANILQWLRVLLNVVILKPLSKLTGRSFEKLSSAPTSAIPSTNTLSRFGNKLLSYVILPLLLLYALLVFIFYFNQRDFIYYPQAEVKASGLPVLLIHNQGLTIKVLQVNPNKDDAVIYFGGNAEAVAHNAPKFAEYLPNQTVYMVNYRGYGGSEGEPDEQGLLSDALAVYDLINKQHQNIRVIGRSFGTGIATYLASQRPVEKLVLVSPYDRFGNVMQTQLPFLPAKWLIKDDYNNLDAAAKIKNFTLILYAQFDQVIEPKLTLNLANAFDANKLTAKKINNSNHDNIMMAPEYRLFLVDFIATQ